MESEYGQKHGEEVFYASRNKGTIAGVDEQMPEPETIPSQLTVAEVNERNRKFWEQWAQDGNTAADEHVGFKKLEGEIAKKGGASDPAAVAASIGIKKYGKAGMEEKAQAGRK